MNGIGFLLLVLAVLALALGGAYLHSRRLGWRDNLPCPDNLPCDECGFMIPKGDPIWVNSEGCAIHPGQCPGLT